MDGMNETARARAFDPKRMMFWTLLPASLLLLPLIGGQLTEEVTWTGYDFALAGSVLCGAGFVYALATGFTQKALPRAAVGLAVLGALLVSWAWAVN